VPPGLRAVHPTWIEAGLVDLPPRARAAVAGGAPASPVDVWLARSATAHLPPMIVEPALAAVVGLHAAFAVVDGVPTAPAAAVIAWLDGIGADQLAFATGQALPRLGDAPARIARAPRKGQLGSQRAAIARCQGVPIDELTNVRIGARAIAPRLATLGDRTVAPAPLGDRTVAPAPGLAPLGDRTVAPAAQGTLRAGWSGALAALQLALRLPRPLGVVVHRELVAHAADGDAPAWAALLA
jgi:hypothetical protein